MGYPHTPISRALTIIEGEALDADTLAWLRRGFALSFRHAVPLEIALKLPSTAARRRSALRDYYLRQAAALCTGTLPWPLACELAKAAHAFEVSIWPRWRRRGSAPAEASALEQSLFSLYRHGGHVPEARRLHDLLTATLGEDIAVPARLR